MTELFLKIINMSLTAAFLILAVILLRLIFKKAPKWISCLLWAIVAVRLLVPFTLETSYSVIPTAEPVKTYAQTSQPYVESGVKVIDTAANKIIPKPVTQQKKKTTVKTTSKTTVQKITDKKSWKAVDLLAVVWLSGTAVLLIYSFLSYLRLKKTVCVAVKIRDRVWICDEIDTPFILGILNPRIYIPSGLNGDARKYVLEHEYAHLARLDHIWKPLSFVILAIHWFNPLCWVSYILFGRDVELACDEKAVKDMSKEDKIGYTTTLLNLSCPKLISACPLAYAEIGVKKRVKSILNYKKPAFWLIAMALISSIALSGCFLTNKPAKTSEKDTETSETVSETKTTKNVSEAKKIEATNTVSETDKTSDSENTENITDTDDSSTDDEYYERGLINLPNDIEPLPEEISKFKTGGNNIYYYGNYPGQKNIHRIVSLDVGITSTLLEIEAMDKIVGVDPGSASLPRLSSGTIVLQHTDIEAIINAHPDIVLISDRVKGDVDVERLLSFGICVVEMTSYRTINDVTEDLRFLGALIGESERAENYASDIEECDISNYKKIGEKNKAKDKKKITIIKRKSSECWTLEDDVLFSRMADFIGIEYHSEFISLLDQDEFEKYMKNTDPDIVFYEDIDIYDPIEKAIMSNSNLKDIKAVKNNACYFIGRLNDPYDYQNNGFYDPLTFLDVMRSISFPGQASVTFES